MHEPSKIWFLGKTITIMMKVTNESGSLVRNYVERALLQFYCKESSAHLQIINNRMLILLIPFSTIVHSNLMSDLLAIVKISTIFFMSTKMMLNPPKFFLNWIFSLKIFSHQFVLNVCLVYLKNNPNLYMSYFVTWILIRYPSTMKVENRKRNFSIYTCYIKSFHMRCDYLHWVEIWTFRAYGTYKVIPEFLDGYNYIN